MCLPRTFTYQSPSDPGADTGEAWDIERGMPQPQPGGMRTRGQLSWPALGSVLLIRLSQTQPARVLVHFNPGPQERRLFLPAPLLSPQGRQKKGAAATVTPCMQPSVWSLRVRPSRFGPPHPSRRTSHGSLSGAHVGSAPRACRLVSHPAPSHSLSRKIRQSAPRERVCRGG